MSTTLSPSSPITVTYLFSPELGYLTALLIKGPLHMLAHPSMPSATDEMSTDQSSLRPAQPCCSHLVYVLGGGGGDRGGGEGEGGGGEGEGGGGGGMKRGPQSVQSVPSAQ